MNLSEAEYFSLEKLFDSRTAEFRSKGKNLLKEYYYFDHSVKRKFDYLLQMPSIEGSGEPLDGFFINGDYKGIVVNYFNDAVTFSEAKHFCINEKIKACIDISRQLSRLHDYGLCFNDVHCGNFLIDKEGGHLIDFDEIDYFDFYDHCYKYSLTNCDGNEFLSSVQVDMYKALICYLSLFYNINFEEKLKVSSVIDITRISFLFENTSISYLIDCANSNMFDVVGVQFPDIEEFIPFLLDKERFNYDLEIIKEKVKLLR